MFGMTTLSSAQTEATNVYVEDFRLLPIPAVSSLTMIASSRPGHGGAQLPATGTGLLLHTTRCSLLCVAVISSRLVSELFHMAPETGSNTVVYGVGKRGWNARAMVRST